MATTTNKEVPCSSFAQARRMIASGKEALLAIESANAPEAKKLLAKAFPEHQVVGEGTQAGCEMVRIKKKEAPAKTA